MAELKGHLARLVNGTTAGALAGSGAMDLPAHPIMKKTLLLSLFVATASLASTAGEKWISLFDGKTLNGWKLVQGGAKFEVRDGAIVGTVTEGQTQNTFLATVDDTFTSFIFEAEFRVDA